MRYIRAYATLLLGVTILGYSALLKAASLGDEEDPISTTPTPTRQTKPLLSGDKFGRLSDLACKAYKKGDVKAAKRLCLLLLNEFSLSDKQESRVYLNLAEAFYKEKNYKKSIKSYEQSLKLPNMDVGSGIRFTSDLVSVYETWFAKEGVPQDDQELREGLFRVAGILDRLERESFFTRDESLKSSQYYYVRNLHEKNESFIRPSNEKAQKKHEKEFKSINLVLERLKILCYKHVEELNSNS